MAGVRAAAIRHTQFKKLKRKAARYWLVIPAALAILGLVVAGIVIAFTR